MSKVEDDERRLYQCVRKSEKILKQVDELIEIMNTKTRPPKRRRVSSSSKGSGSSANASSSQPDNNEALVQTITRFLHELKANPTDQD